MEKFFLHTILFWIIRTANEFSFKCMFFPEYCSMNSSQGPKMSNDATRAHRDDHDQKALSAEDLQTILASMNFLCGSEQQEMVSSESFSNLFDEEEPSFEELKESFSVFDRNGDGFIDEHELRTVLSEHGFADDEHKAALELESCREMIRNYDRNRDGKIDFMEFVKLMETSFC